MVAGDYWLYPIVRSMVTIGYWWLIMVDSGYYWLLVVNEDSVRSVDDGRLTWLRVVNR